MVEFSSKPPIIVVCGPTATGKTSVAVELAKRLDGEIVCADSMQIYEKLSVGTARPTNKEMQGVPHHLFGFLAPEKRYSVSEYVNDAGDVICDIHARKKVPIVCGGTGMYINALISGVEFLKTDTSNELRAEITKQFEDNGVQSLLDEINQIDSQYVKTLHPNNVKRIIRTVELIRTTGKCIADINKASMQSAVSYPCVMATLSAENRSFLYQKIEQRVEIMMQENLLNEAKMVYDNRSSYQTAAQAIGYKEFFSYFEQLSLLCSCVDELKKSTRHYAKRQITWFKREPEAFWIDIESNSTSEISALIIERWNKK